mgnify:CR=1 FL=1
MWMLATIKMRLIYVSSFHESLMIYRRRRRRGRIVMVLLNQLGISVED